MLLLAAGCGHSVTPTAAYRDPSSLPQAISVTAIQESGSILLAWSITGDAYRTIDGWNVYRKDGMDAAPTKRNVALVADIVFRDVAVEEGHEYYYSVRSVSAAGVEGAPSHDLVIRYDRVPPPAPTGLLATPGSNAIALQWVASPVSDLATYRVYRDGGIHAADLPDPTYLDMPVVPGIPHRYSVTAVDRNGNESARSDSILATALAAADTTPPDAPTALSAVPAAAGIALDWISPGDADLRGHYVYRKGAAESAFSRLAAAGVVVGTSHLDDAITSNTTYAYYVTAIDSAGNESLPSPEASATWVSHRVDTGGATLGSVYPWCGVVANSGRMQFLIPAVDIGRAGTIDTLGLWFQSGAAIYNNVSVSLSQTTATTLQAVFADNRAAADAPVSVFGPSTLNLSSPIPASVLQLPLVTPFSYDGSQNLLVEVSWNGDDNRTVVFAFRSSPGANRRLWAQPDGGATRLEPYQQFVRLVFR